MRELGRWKLRWEMRWTFIGSCECFGVFVSLMFAADRMKSMVDGEQGRN